MSRAIRRLDSYRGEAALDTAVRRSNRAGRDSSKPLIIP
jgi:hypothetical protein